jgi:type IV pilus assembly protein PilN
MAKINLLPWREELRKQKLKEFGQMAGIFAVAGAIIWGLVHWYHVQLIEYHDSRNRFIENEAKLLDKKIKEIEELEREKQRLLDRMLAIEQLQSNRPLIVRFFDELITSLPEGVSVNSVTQSGTNITITGEAQSYARVASLMRDLEASEWLANPKLDVIQGTDAAGMRISSFTLRFSQVIPSASEEEGGA